MVVCRVHPHVISADRCVPSQLYSNMLPFGIVTRVKHLHPTILRVPYQLPLLEQSFGLCCFMPPRKYVYSDSRRVPAALQRRSWMFRSMRTPHSEHRCTICISVMQLTPILLVYPEPYSFPSGIPNTPGVHDCRVALYRSSIDVPSVHVYPLN